MNTQTIHQTGRAQASALATNAVIRNTYLLLSMTLMFSALAAGVSLAMHLLGFMNGEE